MRRILFATICAAALAGCANQPPAAPDKPAQAEKPPGNAPLVEQAQQGDDGQKPTGASPSGNGEELKEHILLTPHLRTSHHVPTNNHDIWTDVYTRVRVSTFDLPGHSSTKADNIRSYEQESRNKLLRLLAGRSLATGLNIKVQIIGDGPTFEAVVPTIALAQDSNSEKGENWSTVIYTQSIDRLVRVRAGSKLSIQAEVLRSKETSSHAIKAVLNTAREATKILAPQASVLTSLSAASMEREARVWDSTLGALFSFSLSERVNADSLVVEWQPSSAQMNIDLHLPKDLSDYDPNYNVGTWSISLDCPTPSLFLSPPVQWSTSKPTTATCSTPSNAAGEIGKLGGSRILNYKLTPETSILSHLRSVRAFVDNSQDLLSASNNLAPYALRLCGTILEETEKLGLTQLDGRMVVWAVASNMPDAQQSALTTACSSQLSQLNTQIQSLAPTK